MKNAIESLPPEVATQIDPCWLKNEADYRLCRDRLLVDYVGQWIGFADGKVVASGTSPLAVLHAAEDAAHSPFVVCVHYL